MMRVRWMLSRQNTTHWRTHRPTRSCCTPTTGLSSTCFDLLQISGTTNLQEIKLKLFKSRPNNHKVHLFRNILIRYLLSRSLHILQLVRHSTNLKLIKIVEFGLKKTRVFGLRAADFSVTFRIQIHWSTECTSISYCRATAWCSVGPFCCLNACVYN